MTQYMFSKAWSTQGPDAKTAFEFRHLRDYLNGIDNGSNPIFNAHFLNSTIDSLTVGGNIAMGGFKLTGLGAGTTNGDSLRYEQLIGLYLLLTGGTMSGAIAMGSNKVTGLSNASASGDALSWGQAFTSGQITFSPTTTGIKGTTTNDNAAAGNVGEYIESIVSSASTVNPATTVWGDMTSISLTAGDWDTTFICSWDYNGGLTSTFFAGISTTSGNSATGLVDASNNVSMFPAANVFTANANYGRGNAAFILIVPAYRLSLASTTTVYAKVRSDRASGSPGAFGRLSARRVR